MIGVFDYTVILTYLSIISATAGIFVSMAGDGHPYIGIFFLMFCGLCDAFDGKVARTKKNRTDFQKNFGIQIDSLSDVIAFGALPASIGVAVLRRSHFFHDVVNISELTFPKVILYGFLFAILIFYTLAATIRLAYFNVTEEERQLTDEGVRKMYVGLPVTSAALIFPTLALIQYVTPFDFTPGYYAFYLLTAFLFVGKFKIRKPGLCGILTMVGIGTVEFIIMLICRFVFKIDPGR